MNTLAKVSDSIRVVGLMADRLRAQRLFECQVILFAGLVVLLFLRFALYILQKLPEKTKRMFSRLGDRRFKI